MNSEKYSVSITKTIEQGYTYYIIDVLGGEFEHSFEIEESDNFYITGLGFNKQYENFKKKYGRNVIRLIFSTVLLKIFDDSKYDTGNIFGKLRYYILNETGKLKCEIIISTDELRDIVEEVRETCKKENIFIEPNPKNKQKFILTVPQ